MTDITSDCTFGFDISGEVKIIRIETPDTAATGDTIDLKQDTGRTADIQKIYGVDCTDIDGTTGNKKDVTWDDSTGIITLPSISTGTHRLVVIGE